MWKHTNNRAPWQYVHDAFAHAEEEALMHGAADPNDDSLLEKENRRVKEIGRRIIFHAKNKSGSARVKQTILKRDGDGCIQKKVITRRAGMGSTGQLLRIQLAHKLAQAKRGFLKARKTERRKAMEEIKKEAYTKCLDMTTAALEAVKPEKKATV